MAQDPAELAQCKARCLDLLRTGNFADVEVVCGKRKWKCHKAILASRSEWFCKALSGASEEASTGRVSLDRENPIGIDLALKYLYGLGFDVDSSVSEDHFMVQCVALYNTADFLGLEPLRSSVDKAIRSYCDKRMEQLCTRDFEPGWTPRLNDIELSPWALDMVLGIGEAYKHCSSEVKDILMEFIWVGRHTTLNPDVTPIILDLLKDTPDFVVDLISWYATGNWTQEPKWAVDVKE